MRCYPSSMRTGLMTAAALVIAGAGAAFAAAQFIFVRSSVLDDGALLISFKEAGLANKQYIEYSGQADATVTCNCVTKGGRCPSAKNKQVSYIETGMRGEFWSGQNGQVSQALKVTATLGPNALSAVNIEACGGPQSSCPSGQTMTLVAIEWKNISLTDWTTPVGPVPATPDKQGPTNIISGNARLSEVVPFHRDNSRPPTASPQNYSLRLGG